MKVNYILFKDLRIMRETSVRITIHANERDEANISMIKKRIVKRGE